MIEYVLLFICFVNFFLCLGLGNEVLDIKDYLFFKEVIDDGESNL